MSRWEQRARAPVGSELLLRNRGLLNVRTRCSFGRFLPAEPLVRGRSPAGRSGRCGLVGIYSLDLVVDVTGLKVEAGFAGREQLGRPRHSTALAAHLGNP